MFFKNIGEICERFLNFDRLLFFSCQPGPFSKRYLRNRDKTLLAGMFQNISNARHTRKYWDSCRLSQARAEFLRPSIKGPQRTTPFWRPDWIFSPIHMRNLRSINAMRHFSPRSHLFYWNMRKATNQGLGSFLLPAPRRKLPQPKWITISASTSAKENRSQSSEQWSEAGCKGRSP